MTSESASGIDRMDDRIKELVKEVASLRKTVRRVDDQVGDFVYDPTAQGGLDLPEVHIFPVEVTGTVDPVDDFESIAFQCKRIIYVGQEETADDTDDTEVVIGRGFNSEKFYIGQKLLCQYMGMDSDDEPIYRLFAGGGGSHTWFGEVVATGPNSQPDKTGERYWVRRVRIANVQTSGTEVRIVWAFSTGEAAKWIVATNVPEWSCQGRMLRPPDNVVVTESSDDSGRTWYTCQIVPGFAVSEEAP